MRIAYVATRNLATGHSLEDAYEVVVYAESLERSIKADVSRQISVDRSSIESELRGFDRLYEVTTDHIAIGQNTENFEEFLESCINGETFTFDPDSDTALTEVNAMTAMLESTSYNPARSIPGYYQYSFTVRIL
jgi:hypothetical protein